MQSFGLPQQSFELLPRGLVVPEYHQLVVIGNGFDLACGLKSNYYDFFKSRFDSIDGITHFREDAWCEEVDNLGLTAWDFALYGVEGSNWCDIESAIKWWVVQPDASRIWSWLTQKALQRMKSYPFAGRVMVTTNGRLSGEETSSEYIAANLARYVWMRRGRDFSLQVTREGLTGLLRDDLETLEESFADYLSKQVQDNESYILSSRELMRLIAQDEKPESRDCLDDTSVLSFNYTNPFSEWESRGSGFEVTNIHGRLGDEIVFGIDGKDLMGDQVALPFTKTYRIVSMGVRVADGLLGSEIDCIKFFGHSLGEADYSYFQSVFDAVNLYGGKTRLVFYYRPWKTEEHEVTSAEARMSAVNRVAKLLDTYGRTMDNDDHGKNLMHKLLLEGRLLVKEI